jgi:hypothetical protein
MAAAIGVIRGRKNADRKRLRRSGERTDQIRSLSGACEWLLMQYEEIDRKFPIVDGTDDEHIDTLAGNATRRRRIA